MIAILLGVVLDKSLDYVVLDVGGVGYEVFVTVEDGSRMSLSQSAKLYIYEHIRENSHDLYGFLSNDAKLLFEQLLSVNGIGPRVAISILNIGGIDNVRQAIAGGDVKFIQAAQGVGKKVAERVVVELKDKVGLSSVDLSSTGLLQSEAIANQDEAVAALMALGYSALDAVKALQSVNSSLSTEDRVKSALRSKT